jgi:hypothetical protein
VHERRGHPDRGRDTTQYFGTEGEYAGVPGEVSSASLSGTLTLLRIADDQVRTIHAVANPEKLIRYAHRLARDRTMDG